MFICADDEREDIRRIESFGAKNLLFCHDFARNFIGCNRDERCEKTWLPEARIATNCGDKRIPCPNRTGEIKCSNDSDCSKRVPLFVHAVTRTLGVHR